MKLKLLSCFCIVFLILFSCQEETLEQSLEISTTEKSGIIYEEGTIVTVQIESKWLEGNLLGDPYIRNANIYLPKGYNSLNQQRYPVIYLLHGQPSSENSLLAEGPFQIIQAISNTAPADYPPLGFLPWLNQMFETKGMQDAIIVMADATNKFGFSFYSDSPTHGNYEKYIAKEVVNYVDSHYKTIPTSKARAIIGHSMGGYGALRLALKYPHVFSKVAALSPGQFPPEIILGGASFIAMEDAAWGYPGPSPHIYGEPFKFFTNVVFGLAAARLPNPDNPPYYLDLPITFDTNGNPVPVPELIEKWQTHSIMALAEKHKFNAKWLDYIYLEVGVNDELFMAPTAIGLSQVFNELDISHEFETFDGGHFDHLFERLEMALIEISNQMELPQLH